MKDVVKLSGGNIDFVPIWRKHTTESVDFPSTSLLPQIVGALGILEFSLIFIAATVLKDLLSKLELQTPSIIFMLANPVLSTFFALFIAFGCALVILYLGNNMEVRDIHELQKAYRELDQLSSQTILIDILFGFCLGVFAGVFALLILFFPTYFFGIFFFYFFVTFLPLDLALLMGFIFMIAFSTLTFIFFRGRIILQETSYTLPLDYPKSKRVLDIENSKMNPIVCQSCRSFIRADSEDCPVCFDPIIK